MKTLLSVICFLLLAGNIISQEGILSYYYQNEFSLSPPGAMRFGLYGYDNPALLAQLEDPDLLFTWSDQNGWKKLSHYGFFAAVPHFGFAVVKQNLNRYSVTEYKLSTGLGNKSYSIGAGYGWTSGFGYSNIFTLGYLMRPNQYLSLGLTGNFPRSGNREGVVDLAIRPLGNEVLSVFGDYLFRKNSSSSDIKWSAGLTIEALPGIRITGRYFDRQMFKAGVELSLGSIGLSTQANFSKDGDYAYNTYGIRAGSYDRNIIPYLNEKKDYVELNLLGGLKYQRFRLFDNTNTLKDILDQIEAAKSDHTIAGIAINISGMEINRVMLWELRSKLSEFKSSGKKVLIYLDRAGIDGYHFASVADKIVMDPLGTITLEGFVMGRTFLKGTLDKIGIGMNELRYFKYKSAYETFSQDKMSDADREQRQELVDDNYALAKEDICNGRDFTESKFDSLVNNYSIFLGNDAIKFKLADTLARWDAVESILTKMEGERKGLRNPWSLEKFNLPPDNYWGEKPKVAVIYALGACAMDEGINARSLVNDIKAAVDDPNIKAIVLRVDSPGGDALASDLIAEGLRKAEGKKPVIISQGYVAGSGGYWLSMYGDTIVAAPNTITGSIGVIGLWAFNKGLKEELGMTTDYVKRGEHADLTFGFTLPFIGLSLPDRNLNAEEQKKAEESIKGMYNDFVKKVADGRDTSFEYIEPLAQGRVWSGTDGKALGLVDVLGGLLDAVKIASEKAGLKEGEYNIITYPQPGFIDFNMFMPKFFGLDIQEDKTIEHLNFRLKHLLVPMPILPLEDMEFIGVD